MRDSDAEALLKTRDYELIKLTFEKSCAKVNITGYYPKDLLFKSNSYRTYT
jgi:hypothetical protein